MRVRHGLGSRDSSTDRSRPQHHPQASTRAERTRAGYSSAHEGNLVIPLRPSTRPFQKSSPQPSGLTAPTPVITTCRGGFGVGQSIRRGYCQRGWAHPTRTGPRLTDDRDLGRAPSTHTNTQPRDNLLVASSPCGRRAGAGRTETRHGTTHARTHARTFLRTAGGVFMVTSPLRAALRAVEAWVGVRRKPPLGAWKAEARAREPTCGWVYGIEGGEWQD